MSTLLHKTTATFCVDGLKRKKLVWLLSLCQTLALTTGRQDIQEPKPGQVIFSMLQNREERMVARMHPSIQQRRINVKSIPNDVF